MQRLVNATKMFQILGYKISEVQIRVDDDIRLRPLRLVETVLIPSRVFLRPDQRVGEADGVDGLLAMQSKHPVRRQHFLARSQMRIEGVYFVSHVRPIVGQEKFAAASSTTSSSEV